MASQPTGKDMPDIGDMSLGGSEKDPETSSNQSAKNKPEKDRKRKEGKEKNKETLSPGFCVTKPSPYSLELASKECKKSKAIYDYGEVLHKSILFYEAQRSGPLPDFKRIPWREDSCLDDTGHNGENLTGGWFDAGDHVKFGLPMAWSTTVLAWGLIAYKDSYESTGQLQFMLDCIKWTSDYFMRCHVSKDEFYHQVGDANIDHKRWGRAEDMTLHRPALKVDKDTPGSDVAGETSAALAACAIAFKDTNTSYAALLLDHAKQLYEFANEYRGNYPLQNHYRTNQTFGNKLAWAAAWLYFATSDKHYLNEAESHYATFNLRRRAWSFCWGDSCPGVQLLLYILTSKQVYLDNFTNYMDCWLPGGKLPYTPKGLVFRSEWGPLRYAANNAFVALLAADYGMNPKRYRKFGKTQIHYALGDTGRSFIIGFGNNPPKKPHHRNSSCPCPPERGGNSHLLKEAPNPYVLHGAMVGGPGQYDNYVDDRKDYKMNEVACDYNAGFQSAIAALVHLEITGQL
ncbi:endoglucanase F-like [Glandiceps talaboti]